MCVCVCVTWSTFYNIAHLNPKGSHRDRNILSQPSKRFGFLFLDWYLFFTINKEWPRTPLSSFWPLLSIQTHWVRKRKASCKGPRFQWCDHANWHYIVSWNRHHTAKAWQDSAYGSANPELSDVATITGLDLHGFSYPGAWTAAEIPKNILLQ